MIYFKKNHSSEKRIAEETRVDAEIRYSKSGTSNKNRWKAESFEATTSPPPPHLKKKTPANGLALGIKYKRN